MHRATIKIGKWSFDLVATPLKMADGSRAGTVVEWADASIRLQNLDYAGQVAAANRSQAVIEFKLDGTIVNANENFLKTLGYSLGEIQGKHHSMFVEQKERDSAAYREFWAALNRGEYQAAEYKRIGKGGKEIWIQASYNPVFDEKGKPFKVVKFATDVTEQKLRNADLVGPDRCDRKVAGRDRVQSRWLHPHRQSQFSAGARLFAGRDRGPAPQHVRRAGGARQRRPIANSGRR